MADVLLTHSYHLPYDPKQVRKMQPYPPLGTLYAASVLRQHGLDVALFDTMLEEPESGFAEALRRYRPRVVAIYEDNFNFLSKMCLTRMREVAFEMLYQAHRSGALVLAHGSDAADHSSEYLERGFDFVLSGESEWTLAELATMLLKQRDPCDVPGLAFWKHAHGMVVQRQAPAMRHSLPAPARDLVNIENYRRAWHEAHGFFSLNAIASRGCPFRCNWCAKPIYGDTHRANPAASVAEEMRELKEKYHADHVWFADDIFGLNRHWVQDLAREVEKRDCAIPFKIQARADLLTPETVDALRRAGCAEVWIGAESGSQKILDAMDKGLRVEETIAARENLKREGIRACYFLQLGYPGETWEDILQTVHLVQESRPEDIGVSVSYPLPRTRFHERVQAQLGRKRNWRDSDDLTVMFKGAYTDKFYRIIRDTLHWEVESWSNSAGRDVRGSIQRWADVEAMEPHHRNKDATVLLGSEGSQRGMENHPLVPLHTLRLQTGEV